MAAGLTSSVGAWVCLELGDRFVEIVVRVQEWENTCGMRVGYEGEGHRG